MKKKKDPYALRDIYDEMELELITSMQRNLIKHKIDEYNAGFSWEMWQKAKLRNIIDYRRETNDILYRFTKRIKSAIRDVLEYHFHKGRDFKVKIPENGKNTAKVGKSLPNEDQFFGMNEKKLNALVESTTNDFKDIQQSVYRKMDDVYRQTIFKTAYQMASGTISLDKAIDKSVESFLKKGIDCIVYKNGRHVNIADYAEMALRTASHRATLLGEGSKRDEMRVHLVFVSAHANACKLCLPWQGQILIDDVFSHPSEDYIAKYKDKYKLLSDAIKAGLLHPNCRHTLATYFEGVTRLPKTQDPKKALENYNNEQKQRALEREIRKRKRILAGVVSIEEEAKAKVNLRKAQKNLRDFLDKHPEFKRAYRREKIYDADKKTSILTKKEKDAIIKYVSPDAYKLNEKMRNGLELTKSDKEWIANLDRALDKMSTYKGQVTRSVSFMFKEDIEPFIKSHRIGEKKNYAQYLSSTCGKVYNKDAQVQFIIQSKTGKDIRYYNKAEQEILFKADAVFKVQNIIAASESTIIVLEEE